MSLYVSVCESYNCFYPNQISAELFISVASQIKRPTLIAAQEGGGKRWNMRQREPRNRPSEVVYFEARPYWLCSVKCERDRNC